MKRAEDEGDAGFRRRTSQGAGRSFVEADLLFLFFFQAEDGIRDLTVTGVQTCALPISLPRGARAGSVRRGARRPAGAVAAVDRGGRVDSAGRVARKGVRSQESGVRRARERSEERRVGKECRSRWSPYH